MSDLELATVDGVLTYLRGTPFACDHVTALTGGYGNYTYRAHLRTPYQGQATVVLKHGKAHVPGMQSFAFSLDRQTYEVAAMQQLKTDLPADSLVTVPAVYLFDTTANVIVMEDCGERARTLKQFLQDTPPSPAVAGRIGAAVGAFLRHLHTRGSTDGAFHAQFAAHESSRRLSALVTYGRLVSTLTTAPPGALAEPPLEVPAEKLAVIEAAVKKTEHAMVTTNETVVMGDFWPGNVLVVPKHGAEGGEAEIERMYVIDWEMVRPGLAGLDVGQFCAELHLLCRFYPESERGAAEVMAAFLAAYKGGHEVDFGVARAATVHVGAHLMTWTPRIASWGPKEKVREVVQEGINLVVEGWKAAEGYATEGFVRESIMGGLLR